jgi:hypothetical protein
MLFRARSIGGEGERMILLMCTTLRNTAPEFAGLGDLYEASFSLIKVDHVPNRGEVLHEQIGQILYRGM